MGALRNTKHINTIVIHCSATPNGRWVTTQDIDQWHRQRTPPFNRDLSLAPNHRPNLKHIGYHFVIYTTGALALGRPVIETGAHAGVHNRNSIGICLVGTDKFPEKAWLTLATTVAWLRRSFPTIEVVTGHRDLSPDIDGNGVVEPHEWLKTCPGFSVHEWLAGDMQTLREHLLPDDSALPASNAALDYYKVKPGDSLWKIANDRGVAVANLKAWNDLTSDKILVGQNLIVTPGGTS